MPPSKGFPQEAAGVPAGLDGVTGSGASKRQRVYLKIEDDWYDVTQWQSCHPGGSEILEHLHGTDATDAFLSLHSKEAVERLSKLPKVATSTIATLNAPVNSLDLEFRKLRKQLEKDGYWSRNYAWEMFYGGLILSMIALAYFVAESHPIVATLLIGTALQQAGWLGHDMTHWRGKWTERFVNVWATVIPGFSRSWWSSKHNTHHVYPNHVEIDLDIQLDPVFYLIRPTDPTTDSTFRKYQHLYYLPVYAFLYASWRHQSIVYAWKNRYYFELAGLALGYTWLALFPWYVAVGSVLVGGFMVAVVVTATHQSEDMLQTDSGDYSFCKSQFLSTRNAHSANPLVSYLWGGMQFQLEHHLFPTMPRYYYAGLRPRIQKWAKEQGIEYREDGSWEILWRNFKTLRNYAVDR